MKQIFSIFRQYSLGALRDRYSLFWNLVFPLLLMAILVLVFGNMGELTGAMVFRIGLVNFEQQDGQMDEQRTSYAIQQTLEDAANKEEAWIELVSARNNKELDKTLAGLLQELEQGQLHAVLVIPDQFDGNVLQGIAGQFSPHVEAGQTGDLVVYYRRTNQMSIIAVDILSQIVEQVNRAISIEVGLADGSAAVALANRQVNPSSSIGKPFSFVGYIIPGIILMAFLSSGLEIVVERVASSREKGILRRYFASPLHPWQFTLGLLLYVVFLSLVQVILISLFSHFVFNTQLQLLQPLPLFYLVFALFTILSLGIGLVATAKTANAASTLTNALFYPLMFLGGLYFPVSNYPFPISIVVLVNPITYLVNGLRDSLGVFPSPTNATLNIVVPAAWMVGSLIYGIRRFNWSSKGDA